MIFQRIMPQIINQYAFLNAVSVVRLIVQGCQTIVQATLGQRMMCGEQRCKCCAFSAQSTINPIAISMSSQKKLNTSGVESPCERLPGVGSFLANPVLSKEQLVPSCTMRVFILLNTSIGILVHFAIHLFICWH